MKIIWSKDHKSIVLIAETSAEVAFCNIISADVNGHKSATTATTAKYTIMPKENDIAKA